MRSVALVVGLALALASCGKYGPPVRTPDRSALAKAAAAAPAPGAETAPDEDRKESKK